MTKTSNKLILPILIMLFVGPMIAAWVCYVKSDAFYSHTTNAGQLIKNPINFSQLKLYNTDGTPWDPVIFKQHWVLFYLVPTSYAKNCEKNLYSMRQVRIALGKDRNRVERLIVTFPKQATPDLDKLLNKDYSGTQHAIVDAEQIKHFLKKVTENSIALQQGTLYLVDPLGNLMMQYPGDIAPKKLLNDLTRLLKVSQIG